MRKRAFAQNFASANVPVQISNFQHSTKLGTIYHHQMEIKEQATRKKGLASAGHSLE